MPPSLARAVGDLPKIESGRWVHPEDLHITLRYLGVIESTQAPAIEQALSEVRRPPFHIEARGMDLFKNRRQKILFADVKSTRKITTLVAEITDKLAPRGFDFGTRPYHPHVTLARFKRAARLDDYIRKHDPAINESWEAMNFHLVRSGEPDDAGKRYKILQSYPLR